MRRLLATLLFTMIATAVVAAQNTSDQPVRPPLPALPDDASLDETAAYITWLLAANAEAGGPTCFFTTTIEDAHLDGCTLEVRTSERHEQIKETQTNTASISLAGLDPSAIRVIEIRPDSRMPKPCTYVLKIKRGEGESAIALTIERMPDRGAPISFGGATPEYSFRFDDQEAAEQFAKALEHAITLCQRATK